MSKLDEGKKVYDTFDTHVHPVVFSYGNSFCTLKMSNSSVFNMKWGITNHIPRIGLLRICIAIHFYTSKCEIKLPIVVNMTKESRERVTHIVGLMAISVF